ncbi:unnamed protein product, partial [Ectocarpus sp. 8 AP-2014]
HAHPRTCHLRHDPRATTRESTRGSRLHLRLAFASAGRDSAGLGKIRERERARSGKRQKVVVAGQLTSNCFTFTYTESEQLQPDTTGVHRMRQAESLLGGSVSKLQHYSSTLLREDSHSQQAEEDEKRDGIRGSSRALGTTRLSELFRRRSNRGRDLVGFPEDAKIRCGCRSIGGSQGEKERQGSSRRGTR